MDKIILEGLEFFAYHGFYKEERKIGNKYNVDLIVEADLHEAADKDKLSFTIDYETLYRIIQQEMQRPSKLLEHIARQIIIQIYRQFPEVNSIEVSVAKFNPPVGGVCKWAKVTLKRKADELAKMIKN
ncbi:MAG: dihydroneopterin aldolase [Microscillaceae bacterium]|nr:dihydroneopterin aldolase [Microscillaceae bacterium]